MIEQYERQFITYVKAEMKHDQAHNINHILRVVKIAKILCSSEGAKL